MVAEFQDAAVLAIDEMIQERVKDSPVEQRRRREDKSQRLGEVERFARMNCHGNLG
jgi:hypothetical protein